MVSAILENIIISLKSLVRTRRRAFALISGVMLATMIISGIILYSSVLQQRNFESIVGDTAYELTFDKFNNEQFEVLNDLGAQIISDQRVDAYATVGSRNSGNPNDFFENSEIYEISLQVNENGSYVNQNSRTQQTIRPLYVNNQFFSTSIGQSLTDIYYEGDLRLPNVNETIIPRSIATDLGLSIGDEIFRANLTISTESGGETLFASASKSNFTVIGIYDQPPPNLFGFGYVAALDYVNVILNVELLESNQFASLQNLMVQAGHFTLLLSIDETQFTVSDPNTFVLELNRLLNEISETYGDNDLVGYNLISGALQLFTINSIIVAIMYFIISIPVIILSLYVLVYGLTVSLEERKREIAIKKVQGASASQIFKEIRNESILIYLAGIVFGYILATFVAFIIGNAVGFFEIELGSFSDFLDYLDFNLVAVMVSLVITGVFLILIVYRSGKQFIEEEVTSAISRKQEVKHGFLRSTNLDLVFFGIGLIGFGISFAQQVLLLDIDSSLTVILIQLFTPFLIWIGGAVVGSRIVGIIPRFLEPLYLKLFLFKDVSRIIKAGLRRRGDVNKLAIVIILSLAVASMAVIQGTTDEAHVTNNVEYTVGSDFRITTTGSTDILDELSAISGVEEVQALTTISGRISSETVELVGLDPSLELSSIVADDPIMNWERNTFEDLTPEEAMKILEDQPNGVFITPDLEFTTSKTTGDTVSISVGLVSPTLNKTEVTMTDVEVLGVVNLIPGELGGYLLTSNEFIYELYLEALEIPEELRTSENLANIPLIARQYQIDMVDESLSKAQISEFREVFLTIPDVVTITSLQSELNEIEESGTGFGITGLLTLAGMVSLLATFVSSFAFSSIIMERRKREFAVIRAIGARKSQIYKLAMGENFLMMLIGVIWGTLIGVAVAVIFNGFFGVVSGEILRQLSVPRQIIFPWVDLIIFAGITLIGMMLATILSIRQSVNADLTQATRAE